MNQRILINLPISDLEVPHLRESVGWGRRDDDYPVLFERCNFWGGARDANQQLIAFGYVCGTGLEHRYMEDIIVHPAYQHSGIGAALVTELLKEAERFGLQIVTVSYSAQHEAFYDAVDLPPVQADYGE
ncbi:GNAT family N-acetyltransferase [Priestia koreensis]|uniref:GNAT family N-acetyltransferase n=1 Tax=Priestia koreensis TaxID=284581 RepID=UPI003019DA92